MTDKSVTEAAIAKLTGSKKYTVSEKEKVIRTYLEGGRSLESVRAEFQIAGTVTIQRWLRKIGLHEPQLIVRTIPKYSIAFKKQVVFEVQSGSISAEQARIKYKIGGGNTVIKWCKKFNTLQYVPVSNRKLMKDQKKSEEVLREQVKALLAENKDLKLKLEVVDTMVDIAEKQFKIEIRKK